MPPQIRNSLRQAPARRAVERNYRAIEKYWIDENTTHIGYHCFTVTRYPNLHAPDLPHSPNHHELGSGIASPISQSNVRKALATDEIEGVKAPPHSGLSLAPTSSYKHPFFQNWSLLDGQESKAPRVDNSPSSHAKDTGKKKNKGGKHRQDPKAERGRYPAKSIEYGTVAGLAINVSRLSNLLPVCRSVA